MKKPFIKVVWQDTQENFTPERIKRVKTYFQKKYNSDNVRIVTKTVSEKNETRLKTLEVTDNILDPQYQKTLMKDFLEENNVEVNWNMIDRLDNRVNGEIDKDRENTVRYNKWFIKKIEFSNFLSYGEDNVIDFEQFDGISVIESTPKNFSGKTTLGVDLLMFLFFNVTTKTKVNADVFNKFTDEDTVSVKGYLTIDGSNFIISRTLTRKKSKSGDYNVKSELEFWKELPSGGFENLSGEQRRETEMFITSAIGSEEDFLATIMTTGNNLEDLIDSKPTARGQLLTKLLGLESLKKKEEICRSIYNEWSKKLVGNTHNITQLENDIKNYQENIKNSVELTEKNNVLLDNLSKDLVFQEKERDLLLTKRNDDIDQELLRLNPTTLNAELNSLIVKKEEAIRNFESIELVKPSKYYVEDDHNEWRNKIMKNTTSFRLCESKIKEKEGLKSQLENGTICPTCKQPLKNVDHTSEITSIGLEIEELKRELGTLSEEMISLRNKNDEFERLKRELDSYEHNKLRKERFKLEYEQKDHEILVIKTKIDKYEYGKKRLQENQEIDRLLIGVRTKIETITSEIRFINNNLNDLKNKIINDNQKIEECQELIKKIRSEEELQKIFITYLMVYGKNGVAKSILKNMIPLLNQELQRLLSDSCYFILELNINEKNEVEFIMIDTETRVAKSLASGSGYEKTIASLALRSVLTKISSLPKPNVIVMDEVFGKIADENLDMVGEFFRKIKLYFEHIFIISHNPLVRNWSDNVILVKKEENVSSVESILKNIS